MSPRRMLPSPSKTDPASAAHAYRRALETARAISDGLTAAATEETAESLAQIITNMRQEIDHGLKWTIDEPSTADQIVITSGYGYNTKAAYVAITIRGAAIQLSSTAARTLAMAMVDSAAAAECDKITYDIFSDQLGLELPQIGAIIARMRDYRERLRKGGKQQE